MDGTVELINAAAFDQTGLWLGVVLSLALFSLLIRDNLPARLAQYLLTGALMGYIALVAWQDVLRPRLVDPLLRGDEESLLVPALLGFVLVVTGLQRILTPPDSPRVEANSAKKSTWVQRIFFNLGRIPVAILVGVGLGVGMVGAIEGTFWPQYLRAAQIALEPSGPTGRMVIGLLTLILTTGVMLHLFLDPGRFVNPQPNFVRRTLGAWMWIGRHALWFGAGVLFARLLAARMSLLIAQFQRLAGAFADNPAILWLGNWLGR
jgi:hypothetical protein